jgi:hypothetical protein
VLKNFLERHPAFQLTDKRELVPFENGVDGAFAARLVLGTPGR